jgi:hypothetical protein
VTKPSKPSPGSAPQGPDAGGSSAAEGGVALDAGSPDAGMPIVESAARDALLGGTHWRLVTHDGVVHVWRPPGFVARSAVTVLYVHGYYTDVDGAWADHRLAAQFKQSGRNALFIVPEAPSGGPQDVQFKDLGVLLAKTARLTGQESPAGAVIAIGHSGAYRTLASWLSHDTLREVVLLDALYWNEPEFESWAASASATGPRRLVLVSYETAVRSEAFLARFPAFVRRSDIPKRFVEFTRAERAARLLYLQSQYDHMALVTEGEVIPVLLGLPLSAR